MTFRYPSKSERLFQLRSTLNNARLYDDLHQLATRIMCDVFNLDIENCHKISQEAIHYRDNLLMALIDIILFDRK